MSARPKTARGRSTRERIVREAAELIHRQGVHATSVDEILEAADAGKGQFYHYFDGKEELVRAVLEHQMRRSLQEAVPVLARLDSWEGIEEWFELILEGERNRGFVGGCPVGSLAAEMAETDERLRADLVEAFRVKERYLLKGLRAMKERGELVEEAEPRALAAFTLATIQGGLLMASTMKSGDFLRNALRQALRHLKSHAA